MVACNVGGPVELGARRRAGRRAAAKLRARAVPIAHVLELKFVRNRPGAVPAVRPSADRRRGGRLPLRHHRLFS